MTEPAAEWREGPPRYYAAISRFASTGLFMDKDVLICAYGGPTAYVLADSYEHAARLVVRESDLPDGPIVIEVDE